MKKILFSVLGLILCSGSALANVGAAINIKTGRINFKTGTAPRGTLVMAALDECREHGARCRAVNNEIGHCENAEDTGAYEAQTANHNEADGWKGYLACGATIDQAQELVSTLCAHCELAYHFTDHSYDR